MTMNIAVGSELLPGISGFPMSHRPLLRTRDVDRAEKFIHELAEPFRFSWDRLPARSDVMLTGVQLEKVNVFGVYQSASVLIRSAPLRSHYIVVPLQGEVVGAGDEERVRTNSGEALLIPAGSCLNAHWSEHCVALVVAIRREELLAAARRLGAADPAPAAMRKLVLSSGPGRSFANVLGCLCAESDGAREGNAAPGIREGLQDLLLESLVGMNVARWPRGIERASSRRRRQGVARAVEYMESNAHRAVTSAELARVACLSLRSLQIAFAECFDVGPMTYLRRMRLVRARAELTSLDPRDVQLAGFAARWGFSSPSTFSRVYRRTFDELPSQTLKAARRSLRRGRTGRRARRG